jgi:excisionase family DNA binding protein
MSEEATNKKLVFTVRETAKLLGMCEDVVRREIYAGTIPAVRIGRRYFISKSKLDAMLNGETPEAA